MSTASIPNSQAKITPLTTLAELLPRVLQRVSFRRGQMISERINSVLREHRAEDLLVVVAGASEYIDDAKSVSAAAICLLDRVTPGQMSHTSTTNFERGATILFAGELDEDAPAFAPQLSLQLDAAIALRGARFVQWAEDLPAGDRGKFFEKPTALMDIDWPTLLGFELLADLQYMRRDVHASNDSHSIDTEEFASISLTPIDWKTFKSATEGSRPMLPVEFHDIVDRTYVETLDCPQLSTFQSTAATLAGYCQNKAFAPDLWFNVSAATEPHVAVGCLILARHTSTDIEAGIGNTLLELVYMGIIPEYRGRGLSKDLVAAVNELALAERFTGVVLAVDARNHPAARVYSESGFVPVLCERIFGKRLAVPNSRMSWDQLT